jgi:hypothetical protein
VFKPNEPSAVYPRGIIIADDVYNTYAIGVSEAFFRYRLS